MQADLTPQPPQQNGPVAHQAPHSPSNTPEDPPTPERAADGRTDDRLDQTPDADLTADEARALAERLGYDLFRAQDALAFVREMCDIADRHHAAITTADVRTWLKGPQYERQWAAEAQPDTGPDSRTDSPDTEPDSTVDTQTDNPTTSTDTVRTSPDTAPDDALREQYAATLRDFPIALWTPEALADRILRVRDRRMEQLRTELAAAQRELTTSETARAHLRAQRDRLAAEVEQLRVRAEQAEDLLRVAHDTSNRSEAERADAEQRAKRAEAEVQRWLAFIERGITEHMQFGLLHPDGTTEQLPCADWCYACRVEKAEAAITRVRALRERTRVISPDAQGPTWEALDIALDGAPGEHEQYTDAIRRADIADDTTARTKELLTRRTETLRNRAERAEAERDQAYAERAALLAWISALHPANAVITTAADVDEPGWQLLFLLVGGWQMSWHIHPRDAELFAHVEQVEPTDPRAQWDGHTTEAKYQRIQEHTRRLSQADTTKER
ncbi:hypothetical protein [Streptomyces asiaticus]|uniref:hypothetical protein n=1 Tax=Streptomyces asiaticus TaxID=114695 RepID=UPI003805F1D6